MSKLSRISLIACALLVLTAAAAFTQTQPLEAAGPSGRFIASAKSDADFDALRSDIQKNGGSVVREMRNVGVIVATGPTSLKPKIAASTHAAGIGTDRIEKLVQPSGALDMFGNNQNLHGQKFHISFPGVPQKKINPDPAFDLPGLMWNVFRVNAPETWKHITTGLPAVQVGVADTGLDFTHPELAPRIANVVDFTAAEVPPLCQTFFGASDADFAAQFGGPPTTDWNGHGSWIGGNIAAAADGMGINGIAPNIKLVALKISGWCGSAYDSTILDAFQYAADHNIDIVSISFGGYLDRSDPDQDAIYKAYVQTVAYALRKGTIIVAAAGNEHLRIGAGGQVISHGPLTTPGTAPADFFDYFGLYETPGGIPGVVDVSSTGNVVNASSLTCAVGTFEPTNATCKPTSDPHQQSGVGKQNQLAYYSNYGPRIDVAAPGGARKFNLPFWDRGGTPGFPYTTADGTNVWEDFSITSNWALEIPCFLITGPGFDPNQCYTAIQGTSMATPHASAVLALILSKHPGLQHFPLLAIAALKIGAQNIHGNTTPVLSAGDLSAGEQQGTPCPTGYCHLGGPAVSDNDAYGAGLVNALSAGGPGF